jgi:hypothetical protein
MFKIIEANHIRKSSLFSLFTLLGITPIKEEVYIEQPPGFEDSEYPNHVYKSQKRFMGSSKPQEHDMNACEISLLLMASKSKKPILHSLLKLLQQICLYAKFMLMISYLGLLTSPLVKSLVGS